MSHEFWMHMHACTQVGRQAHFAHVRRHAFVHSALLLCLQPLAVGLYVGGIYADSSVGTDEQKNSRHLPPY